MSDIAANRPSAGAMARTIPVTGIDWGLLIIRLAIGIVFVMHGWPKLIGWSQTMAAMTHTGIPAPFVALDIITEFFGGLALIFGVLARLASLGIIVVMLVAIFKVHLPYGFFMNWFGRGNQKGEGIEYHLLVIAMALMVVLAGPGRLALAHWERRWIEKTS